ncbi:MULTISPECIES: thermostable hemolysin [Marinobacter]|uniref:thermostable hemolysin n=1 Tax=Marinobacter TaxID=2742 RepID=UPI0025724140|nr:thermostable hemolysin [Marinobacter shengliensis]WBU41544.1 thermostable hemolysin [Marinobacter alkaliphilus]BEH12875.1 thermostable hemolysin [Marinobacter shengliensis]
MTDPLTMSTCCPPDSPAVTPVLRCAGRWFSEIAPQSAMATTVAEFIRRRFLQAYGAEPKLRIPSLLALTTAQGSLMAAVGVRNAGADKLFLEDYLSVPVQSLMPESGTERHRIAEIAHLAGVEAGVSRYLFASLSVWLDSAGYDWVVCTGTDQLRNSFHRLGIATQVLANADPSKLPDGGAGWGRYYDHHPVVMTIRVAEGMSALREVGLLKLVQPVVPTEIKSQPDLGGAYGRLA